MTRTSRNFSFKELLTALPRGEPFSTEFLAKRGLRTKHAVYLAAHGWLIRLGHGTYMLPGDTLTRDGCLAFMATKDSSLHAGGKTALAWRGVRHNLATKETIELWGERRASLPLWLTERFPCRYQTTAIFDNSLAPGLGLAPLPNGRTEVLVSVPERALLELLSDVGKSQMLEETRNLVEGVRNLRESVMAELLAHVNRIKVVRLARLFAEELDLPWLPLTRTHSERLGGAGRWIAVTRTGERLELKRK